MQERKVGLPKDITYDAPDSNRILVDIEAAEAQVRMVQTDTDVFLDKFATDTYEAIRIVELICGSPPTTDSLDEYCRIQGLLKSTILGAVDRLLQFLDIIPSQIHPSSRTPDLDNLGHNQHRLPAPVQSDERPDPAAAAAATPTPADQTTNLAPLMGTACACEQSGTGRSCSASSPSSPTQVTVPTPGVNLQTELLLHRIELPIRTLPATPPRVCTLARARARTRARARPRARLASARKQRGRRF
jgi:hypothetical protein